MATLSKRGNSRFIQFELDGRRTLSLGRIDHKTADRVRGHVERIILSRRFAQSMPPDTAAWVAAIDNELHERLVKVGLADPRRAQSAYSIAELFDLYIAKRFDLKKSTVTKFQQARRECGLWFGLACDVRSITPLMAEEWHVQLHKRLSAATIAARVKDTKQVFAHALELSIVDLNPFARLKGGKMTNPSRQQYVPAADIELVIAACTSVEWKLVFAIARYAGLRVPSELNLLRWADVNLEARSLFVRSPKTEHHKGKADRLVPIVPALYAHLKGAKDTAGDAEFVIKARPGNNLSTTGHKFVKRAGLKVWPRFYQNLRASCQTDFIASHPAHVACAWIGNSEIVARNHYLMMLDADWQRATGRAAPGAADNGGNTQNPAVGQSAGMAQIPQKSGESGAFLLGDEGLALTGSFLGNLHISERALHGALQNLSEGLPYIRADMINRLQAAVDAARVRTGGVA